MSDAELSTLVLKTHMFQISSEVFPGLLFKNMSLIQFDIPGYIQPSINCCDSSKLYITGISGNTAKLVTRVGDRASRPWACGGQKGFYLIDKTAEAKELTQFLRS